MKEYYYYKDEQQLGPLSPEALIEHITPDTYIFCDGMEDWEFAKDIPEINALFTQEPEAKQDEPTEAEEQPAKVDEPAEENAPTKENEEPIQPAPCNTVYRSLPVPEIPDNVPDFPDNVPDVPDNVPDIPGEEVSEKQPAPVATNGEPVHIDKKVLIGLAVALAVLVIFLCGYIIGSGNGDGQQVTEDVALTENVEESTEDFAGPEEEVEDMSFDRYRWLQERYATEEDIEGMTSEELRIMRNFIFAYHGYIFNSDDLTEYFSQYPEYSPEYSYVTSDLNPVELENIEFIKSYE